MSLQAQLIGDAFTKQSVHYDEHDRSNIILRDLRLQVYDHVEQYLKPQSAMLELNAGTGIDAEYFCNRGHRVHATDLSSGMLDVIRRKLKTGKFSDRLTVEQISFDSLAQLRHKQKFDYVFSNFGGLNTTKDLRGVAHQLPALLRKDGYVTFVIMPRVCPWELMSVFKGNVKRAFRRLSGSAVANVEGTSFTTYYFSLGDIVKSFPRNFKLVQSEGLAAIGPPPSKSGLPTTNPSLYRLLTALDARVNNRFPFNRWADHLIVTFQFSG